MTPKKDHPDAGSAKRIDWRAYVGRPAAEWPADAAAALIAEKLRAMVKK